MYEWVRIFSSKRKTRHSSSFITHGMLAFVGLVQSRQTCTHLITSSDDARQTKSVQNSSISLSYDRRRRKIDVESNYLNFPKKSRRPAIKRYGSVYRMIKSMSLPSLPSTWAIGCMLALLLLDSEIICVDSLQVNTLQTTNKMASSPSSLENNTQKRRSNSLFPLQASIDSSDGNNNEISRRQLGELSVAALGLGVSFLGTREVDPTDYGLWGILPVGPYKQKKTIRETIVPNQMWTFDQKFGILNVQVPLRMTIIKLGTGGLFVYNPVAATPECLELVNEIVEEHGPIKHIVLGSLALEHKVYSGVFAQKFPTARVWLQPGQYSFPSNLPDSFLGFPPGRTNAMPQTMDGAPDDWKTEFEFATLGPFISRDGAFGETVFLHKPTKTLLVTDTAVEVSEDVPEIFDSDPKALLYHARDTITDVVQDTPETRRKGWRRVQLFGLYFNPSGLDIKDVGTALKDRRPDINPDFAGLYPWDWIGDEDVKSYKAISGGLLVAPILQTLLVNRFPVESLDFANTVGSWDIKRIIPCHLKNNLTKYTGKDYKASFGFLTEQGIPAGYPKPLAKDLAFLLESEEGLLTSGAISKRPPLVGGKYTRDEIIQQTVYRCRADVCAPQAPLSSSS